MKTGDITIATADGPMRGYEAVPDGAPRGAIVVVQEAFGVNPHIEDVTRRCADAGYHAVAPDLFHRSGPGSVIEYGKFEQVLEFFKDVGGDEAVLVDIRATLDHLRATGFGDAQIGIVGFCFGGRVTFLVSLRRALGAGVGFYGGGIATKGVLPFPALVDDAASLQTPWLGLFGAEDASIPVPDVERLREALRSAAVDADVVRYPGAGHGFHCDARADYHELSAKDAWGRTLAWFGAHLRA